MNHSTDSHFQFECTQCGRCCSRPGAVYASDGEVAGIARALDASVTEVRDAFFVRDEDHWVILVDEGETCPFLQNNQCSIHHVKPVQCRTYPFWPEILATEAAWQEEAAWCPGINVGKIYSELDIVALLSGKGQTS